MAKRYEKQEVERFFDGTEEDRLKKKIKKRLLKLAKKGRIHNEGTRHLDDIFWKYTSLVDAKYGALMSRLDKQDKSDKWYCGLGQIVDLTDPEIYEVIPYLLTAYMYNFYLIRNGEKLYLDGRRLRSDTMVREFLDACKKEKAVRDKALFGITDTKLPGKGIGNLLQWGKDGCDESFDCDDSGTRNKLGYKNSRSTVRCWSDNVGKRTVCALSRPTR